MIQKDLSHLSQEVWVWLPKSVTIGMTLARMDGQTDKKQTLDKVIPMCHYVSQVTHKQDLFVKHFSSYLA